MKNLIQDDLTDVQDRAQRAVNADWPEDAECMGQECLALIAEVRKLRKLVPVAKVARRVVRNSSGDLHTEILDLEQAIVASRKKS